MILDAEPEPRRGRWAFVLGMEVPQDSGAPIRGHWKVKFELEGAELKLNVAARLFRVVVHVELEQRNNRIVLAKLRLMTPEEFEASRIQRGLEDRCTCGVVAALHSALPPHARGGACKGFVKA